MQVILRLDPGGLEARVVDEVLRDKIATLAVTLDVETVIVDHHVRNDLLPSSPGARPSPPEEYDPADMRACIRRACADPGAYVERDMKWGEPRWEGDSQQIEPLHVWQARAVQHVIYGETGVS